MNRFAVSAVVTTLTLVGSAGIASAATTAGAGQAAAQAQALTKAQSAAAAKARAAAAAKARVVAARNADRLAKAEAAHLAQRIANAASTKDSETACSSAVGSARATKTGTATVTVGGHRATARATVTKRASTTATGCETAEAVPDTNPPVPTPLIYAFSPGPDSVSNNYTTEQASWTVAYSVSCTPSETQPQGTPATPVPFHVEVDTPSGAEYALVVDGDTPAPVQNTTSESGTVTVDGAGTYHLLVELPTQNPNVQSCTWSAQVEG